MFLPRYFYKNVWMPWDNDNDDEQDWADKHLKSRIQFNFDLMKSIDRPLAAHIRALLQEARDIEERRAFLETDLSEDEDLNETNRKCLVFLFSFVNYLFYTLFARQIGNDRYNTAALAYGQHSQ